MLRSLPAAALGLTLWQLLLPCMLHSATGESLEHISCMHELAGERVHACFASSPQCSILWFLKGAFTQCLNVKTGLTVQCLLGRWCIWSRIISNAVEHNMYTGALLKSGCRQSSLLKVLAATADFLIYQGAQLYVREEEYQPLTQDLFWS